MIVLLIGLIIAGVYLLAKKGVIRFKKMSYWVLGIYAALVLISSVAVPLFLDKKPLVKAENEGLMEYEKLYDTLSRAGIGEIDNQYILNRFRFEQFDEAVLTLAANGPYVWTSIFVERKTAADGLIEGFIVGQPLTFNGYVFPEAIKPVELKLEGSTLAIETVNQELNISAARSSFPVRQFTGETNMDDLYVTDQMIYLKVPAGVKVETEDESIYFNYTEE